MGFLPNVSENLSQFVLNTNIPNTGAGTVNGWMFQETYKFIFSRDF